MRLFFCFLSVVLCVNTHALYAQNNNNPLHLNSIKEYERVLKPLSDSLLRGSTDEVRKRASIQFLAIFKETINQVEAYRYPFDSLKHISKIYAPDNNFRIYTWMLPSVDGNTFKYFGYIQQVSKPSFITKLFGKKAVTKTFELKDKATDQEDLENIKLKADKWYGALYYKILKDKSLGKTYYTLIGFRSNNSLTNIKLLDDITINNDKITFGQGLFKSDKLIKRRIIMKYSSKVSMSLRFETDKVIEYYDKNKGIKAKAEKMGPMIIFDHVSPSDPSYEGQYEFYGPDGSFDGYAFKKGKWQLYQALDIQMDLSPKAIKLKAKPRKEGLGKPLR
jgi:hypothetical protein